MVAKLVKEFDSGKIIKVTHVVAITPRGVQNEGHGVIVAGIRKQKK
ncbi:MAG: hypothetical protein J6Q45_01635 [Alistipes sp.]|nr:hypothetical protein [Alistipes sp.]